MDLTIDKAIQIATREVKDPYAQTYLRAIPRAIEEGGEEGLEVQVLYAFSNTSSWRGETAREVKTFVKSWLKNKKRL